MPGTPQSVTVAASSDDCTVEPALVAPGPINVTATASGDETVSVTVFGPKGGQFKKPYGRIASLKPGATKTFLVTLELGAYEVACIAEHDDHRDRLTAV